MTAGKCTALLITAGHILLFAGWQERVVAPGLAAAGTSHIIIGERIGHPQGNPGAVIPVECVVTHRLTVQRDVVREEIQAVVGLGGGKFQPVLGRKCGTARRARYIRCIGRIGRIGRRGRTGLGECEEYGLISAAQLHRQPAGCLLLIGGIAEQDVVLGAPAGIGAEHAPVAPLQQLQRPVSVRLHADEDGAAARIEDRLRRLQRSRGPPFVQPRTGEQDRRGEKQ